MTFCMRNTEKNTDKNNEVFPFIVNTLRAADIADPKLAQQAHKKLSFNNLIIYRIATDSDAQVMSMTDD